MSNHTRREFLKRSGVGVAGLSLLPSKLIASTTKNDALDSLPPHKPMIVPAVDKIHFHISNTVPHRLGIYRLGLDPESPSQDELLHQFPEGAALPQPIH